VDEQDRQSIAELTALLVDNPDFEKLETILDQFNLFEAIGMVRDEVKHSAVRIPLR